MNYLKTCKIFVFNINIYRNHTQSTELLQSKMLSNDMKKKITKSAITGGVLAAVSTLTYGSGDISLFNTSIPSAVPIFISGAGASIISDIAHDKLYPQLPTVAHKLSDITAVATGAGISGAATAGILSMTGLPNDRLLSAALIGGGSYVASDYIEMKLFTENGQLIF